MGVWYTKKEILRRIAIIDAKMATSIGDEIGMTYDYNTNRSDERGLRDLSDFTTLRGEWEQYRPIIMGRKMSKHGPNTEVADLVLEMEIDIDNRELTRILYDTVVARIQAEEDFENLFKDFNSPRERLHGIIDQLRGKRREKRA